MPDPRTLEEKRASIAKARAAKANPGATSKRDADGFLPREREFVLHYLGAAARVATDAYLMSGYAPSTRGQARRLASDLMARPHVIAEIERITAERAERLNITADDVLRRLLRLEVDVMALGKSAPAMRTRLDTIKAIGEHVAVGAFRKQVGLSSPSGGPIETVDLAALANLSDEELDQLERARSIVDRIAGGAGTAPGGGGDSSGEGAAPEGE